jgi:Ca2+-binding RTX toxin-like protein
MMRSGTRFAAATAVFGAVVFGAAAGPAFGSATVTFHPGASGLRYQATPGDGVPSALSITFDANTGDYKVHDLFETLTAGVGCHAVDMQEVDCHAPHKRPARRVIAHMEDGNDIVTVEDPTTHSAALVFGGSGNDTIVTGVGADAINGGPGNDRLFGHDGPDSLNGGAGNDVVDGESGDDFVFGGDGKDNLKGEDGHDLLKGGNGNDLLSGGNQGDRLFGGAGKDTLHGNAGKDLLDGGEGDDQLHSRDGGTVDNDKCGGGQDTATADAVDTHSGCESFQT